MEGKTHILITENLHQTLHGGMLNHLQKKEVYDMIGHYMSEYNEAKQKTNTESAIYNFLLAIDEVQSREKVDNISCKKGCAFCCSIHVDITSDEAFLLTELAKSTHAKLDKEKLQRQANKNISTWKELKVEDRRCIFLNDVNECTVYKCRPSVCRNYRVISKPELCDMENKESSEVLKMSNVKSEIFTSAIMNCSKTDSMAKQLLTFL